MESPDDLKLKNEINQLLEEVKAIDIKNINLSSISPTFDNVFVASGSSIAHVRGIMEKVIYNTSKKPIGIEGKLDYIWILIDYGSIIIHIILDEYRNQYNFEDLYQKWIDNSKSQESIVSN